ncbi:MAG: PDZ domain-containing protein [Planctomycetota bacterium]|nr:MAG: PDZ domain-containing protein [Planctomycetota bacterium]
MAARTLPALHPAGIAAGVALCAAGVAVAEWFLGPLLLRGGQSPEERTLAAVQRTLAEEYVEPRAPEWLLHRAVQGMVDGLHDPYTYFIEGDDGLRALQEESTGQLEGIGVRLDPARAQVRWPQPGGPAEAAGVQPGDIVVAVDGVPTDGMDPERLQSRIKGPAGSSVHLALLRASGERLEVDVVRGAVPTGTVRQVEMLDPERGIATLQISSFAASTPQELDDALAALATHGLRALVLDLRYNRGGVLTPAVATAARFLRGGVVCTLYSRGRAADTRRADPSQSSAADLPVVVLLNGLSASGSEVLAGALRDYGAALLAGERSYGKGVFQQVFAYRQSRFGLKFTAGYYVTPGGRILEGHIDPERAGGLEPDLAVAAPADVSEALAAWLLRHEDPPAKYRERVFQLFPELERERRPPDPVLEVAVAHLKAVLQPA